jgi:DNA-binding winged helix-turn-helix (wHTH) protein
MAFYFFGAFEFDERKGILLRKGEARNLRPQSAQLLKLLLENSDRTVTKEEIIEQVWNGEYISDQVLFQCMNDLRKALGETAKDPSFIRTIPRKGYRWIYRNTDVKATEKMTVLKDLTAPNVQIPSQPLRRKRLALWIAAVVGILFILSYWHVSKVRHKNKLILISIFDNQTGDSGKAWLGKELQGMLIQELTAALTQNTSEVYDIKPLDDFPEDEEIAGLLQDYQAEYLFRSRISATGSDFQIQYQIFSQDKQSPVSTAHGASLEYAIRHYTAQTLSLLHENKEPIVFSPNNLLNENYVQGKELREQGEFQRALLYFNICNDKDPAFLLARIGAAECEMEMGNFAKADSLLLSMNSLEEVNRTSIQLRLLRAKLKIHMDTTSNTQRELEQALSDAQKLGFQALESECHEKMAELFFLREKMEDCRTNLEMAQRGYEKQGNLRGLARCSLISQIFTDISMAESLLLNSLETFKQEKYLPGVLSTQNALANLYVHTARIDEGKQLLNKVASEAKDAGLKSQYFEAELYYGHACFHTKDTATALSTFSTILPDIDASGDKSLYVDVLNEKMKELFFTGQTEEALIVVDELLQNAREIEYDAVSVETNVSTIEYLVTDGDPQRANAFFNKLKAIADEDSVEVIYCKAFILYGNSRFDDAVKYMEKARDLDRERWESEGHQILLDLFNKSKKDGKLRTIPQKLPY